MKNKYKLSAYFVICLLSFLIITSFDFTKVSKSSNQEARPVKYDRDYHHRHRRGGSGIQFRFDIGPPRRYYYYDEPYYYNRYVPLYCEVYDDGSTKVVEVQIGNSIVHPNDGSSYSFSLRPGYHTVRWRVKNNKFFGEPYRNFSKTISVHRNLEQIYVKIKGSDISINYVEY